ncbi:ABC transporter [Mycobacterium sp. IS-1742]|uniref:zinc ABC transporter permease AztB n=1 Tax=Mycobacterium sp. IS-1742 TaxID=1772285 RepID=UPI00073FCD31|nr:zinc ABC transporter permease AztB [Mycobacterium sp. IS-1742]KUI33046.1 ABC transporter [Mycobacterium sp. IS-1742]
MTDWLTEPFEADVVVRALAAGVLAACVCALVGCWVVLRGSVFLGDAMAHGMLPGVAVAALVGGNLMLGGLVAAVAMAVGIAAVGRSARLASDTAIGLLLVGMLALGVVIVSRSQSFAVDLTGFLFGDVLAVRTGDLAVLAVALLLTLAAVVVGQRAFVAVTFDPRKAATLGLRPELAVPALTVLVAIAMVASFHVVGTLLVLGLLIAPPATALLWARSVPRVMLIAAALGSAAVVTGLVISWHAGTAGGATIAGVAVLAFFVSTAASRLLTRWRRASAVAVGAFLVVGCSDGGAPPPGESPAGGADMVVIDGAREVDGPLTRLVLADPGSGATAVYDAETETETAVGSFGPVTAINGDGRFAYLSAGDRTTIVDAGTWTFDHGDHSHYFVTEPARVGGLDAGVESVAASNSVVAVRTTGGGVELLDRDRLGDAATEPPRDLSVGEGWSAVVPYGSRLVAVTGAGRMQVVDADGATDLDGECRAPTWSSVTRRAVVLGCRTGAVRVTGGEGQLAVTSIPFPHGVPARRPARMEQRDRADVFAGVTPDTVWVLDSRQRSWTVIPAPGAVTANTAGDGTALVLYRDGTIGEFDVDTAAEIARAAVFAGPVPEGEPAPVIELDTDRAYVNNAAAREIYEIDYADGLRIARVLRTEVAPGLMVETGR